MSPPGAYFDMLKAEGKAKSIALVVEESPHPKEVAAGAIPKAKEVGLRVVGQELLPGLHTRLRPNSQQGEGRRPRHCLRRGISDFGGLFSQTGSSAGGEPTRVPLHPPRRRVP